MGCCSAFKNDIFMDKEIIVNLSHKEIEDFLGRNRNDSKKVQKQNIQNFLRKLWKRMPKVQKK